MKKSTRVLWLATAAVGALLALWLAFDVALVGSTLTPPQQQAMLALLGPRAVLLVMSWVFAVAGAAALLHWLVQRHVVAPGRLLERAQVLLTSGADQVPGPGAAGPAPLAALESVVLELARQRDALRDDVAREVARGTRELQEERNQLSALVSELSEGVLVCNLDGDIVLYNARARLLCRALPPSKGPGDGSELVGIGRPIHDIFRRELVEHALDDVRRRLARGAVSPTAQFVTFTRGGQLLRVQVAPVRPAVPGATESTLQGFVLTLANLTRAHDDAARQDQQLQILHQGLRSSLEGLGAATRRLEETLVPAQAQVQALAQVRAHVLDMETRLAALARQATAAEQTRWPLEDMLGSDLLEAAQTRVQSQCGRPVVAAPPEEAIWLRADSFSLLQALSHLARRLVNEFDVKFLTLRLTRSQGRACLDLAWSGHAVSTETTMAWEMDAMDLSGEVTSLSVRDVVARHGSELGFERDRARHEACFRWLLPLSGRSEPHAEELQPEDHDFGLFAPASNALPRDQQPLAALTCTVFDTETTGLSPADGDEVVQLGAVRIVNGKLRVNEHFDQLVNPGRPIPEAAVRIHGITSEMVADHPRFAQVLPAFHAFARDTVLVAHNAAFDMKLLQMQEEATGLRFRQPVLDTLLLSAVAQPHQASHSLDAIADRLGIAVRDRHSALGDALTTAEIFLRLVPLLAAQGIHTLGQAEAASRRTRYARVTY